MAGSPRSRHRSTRARAEPAEATRCLYSAYGMERDRSVTIHQVEEVEKLVHDALVKLDQVQYALRTLEARLKASSQEDQSSSDAP
jgi:hypothetical protein